MPHTDPEVLADIPQHYSELMEKFKKGVNTLLQKLLINAKEVQKRGFNKSSCVTGNRNNSQLETHIQKLSIRSFHVYFFWKIEFYNPATYFLILFTSKFWMRYNNCD